MVHVIKDRLCDRVAGVGGLGLSIIVPAGPTSKQAKQAERECPGQCAAHWNPAVRLRTKRERRGRDEERESRAGMRLMDGCSLRLDWLSVSVSYLIALQWSLEIHSLG